MEKINENYLVSPLLVFFLIHSMQVGIGILGFQRIVAKATWNDSWIPIIISGILSHIIIWMIYKILAGTGGDIIYVHKEVFGKLIGGTLSLIFIIYLTLMSTVVIRGYIEIIQVWMFQDFNRWIFTIFILILVYYVISGGFRIVTGICFFSVVIPLYLVFTSIFPLHLSHIRNLLPVFSHSLVDVAAGTKSMTLSIIGFEVLLMYYPFIKEPLKSKKWAHFGIMFTTFLYLLVMLVSIMFYSEGQLEKQIWATLSMWKIVEMPFVERFEYIGISSWLLVILPNICLSLWASSRGIKRLMKIRQKTALMIIMVIVLFLSCIFTTREQINTYIDFIAQTGFYFIYMYIPILFVIISLKRKLRKYKDEKSHLDTSNS